MRALPPCAKASLATAAWLNARAFFIQLDESAAGKAISDVWSGFPKLFPSQPVPPASSGAATPAPGGSACESILAPARLS
jgi:hypothetical protein